MHGCTNNFPDASFISCFSFVLKVMGYFKSTRTVYWMTMEEEEEGRDGKEKKRVKEEEKMQEKRALISISRHQM